MKQDDHFDIDRAVLDLTTRKMGILRKPVPGSDQPIDDPVSHADRWYKAPFHIVIHCDQWKQQSKYRSTSYFANVRVNYTLHCGPTAVTNLILATSQKYPNTWLGRFTEKDLFEIIASEGESMGLYHNGSWHHLFGGTSDFFAGAYMNRALQINGIRDVSIQAPVPVRTEGLRRWLDQGNLAYLMLHRHECYRNHHVICNGYMQLQNQSGEKITYFQIMDGWSARPRYVDENSLKGDFFWKIQCK